MFLSFSKTIAKFGGFGLRMGIRTTKKNAIWVSLLIMVLAMFKLMWYTMILCGWLIYAVFYGMYWCIKQIVKAISGKINDMPHNDTHKSEKAAVCDSYIDESNPDQSTRDSDSGVDVESNNSIKQQPTRNKGHIVRWIAGGFFAIFALVNGFHYSSLFLIAAAFLMFPFMFVEAFLKKINTKSVIAIILSVVLFFVGVLTSPSSETTDDPSNDTNQSQTEADNSNDTSNNESNSNIENSQQPTKLSPSNYDGPECWLLSTSGNIIEVYADISTTDANWKLSCKLVFTMLVDEMDISTDYSSSANVMIKLYNSKENVSNNQPTYSNLIALWETHPATYITESVPTIIFYPNGAGIAAKQESENWHP